MNTKLNFMLLAAICVTGVSTAECKTLDDVQVLDLVTAQQVALADNPTLAAAAERVEQARYRVKQAEALYYPSIDAGGTATSNRMSFNNAAILSTTAGGAEIDRNSEKFNLSLGASWLVFDGFSRKFSNLIAGYGQEESEQARRDGMRILLQSVAVSYYGAQLAQYNKDIAEADFSFNSKQAQEAQISMNAGAGSLSAVLNFQVQMNNASTNILLAKRDYDLAMFGLAILLGRESGQMPESLALARMDMVQESEYYELAPEELLNAASIHRPDLLRHEIGVQRADSTIGATEASLYPKLALNGIIDGNRSDNADFSGDDFGSTVALNLSYNLFRGGGDKARIAEAKSYKREAARTLEQQKNSVTSDVRRSITNLEQARAQLLLQRASVKLVEQTRDLVEEGYKAGQESLARFNEVQRDLVRTQSYLAVALISLYTNRQALKTATGESLIPYLTGAELEPAVQ